MIETTDWDSYGTGRYEKCANCMAHCGYEPTAAHASISNPFAALWVALRGVRTKGAMAREISIDGQRPATFVFSRHVQEMMARLHTAPPAAAADASNAKSGQRHLPAASE